ncbi:hypothetical protein BV898_18226, partial [Hypsibius exemplaris]
MAAPPTYSPPPNISPVTVVMLPHTITTTVTCLNLWRTTHSKPQYHLHSSKMAIFSRHNSKRISKDPRSARRKCSALVLKEKNIKHSKLGTQGSERCEAKHTS